ncbi:MAG TPA: ABC transporter ATP-binding protein [Candidatus Saccharimonadia bacterium]|nr:ABC transporter ATP-binding protein [Candidatus Saccharimonadia bacterium]
MLPVLVADRLSKRYGARLAVDEVSFAVEAGEVVGLLGPNGSGKTTVLRLLTGYLHPSSGTAHIAGFDVVEAGLAARRYVGYVPEDVPLYSHMRVDEFLAFMGRLKGLVGRPLRDGVASVCQRLHLSQVRSMAIGKLSRGYRQRVAIAQALLNNPPLLLLDEPTNGLDPRQIIEMRALIRALATTHTILVTSHILSEIEKIAHRVAILLDGRLRGVHALGGPEAEQRLRLTIRGLQAGVPACLRAVPEVTDVTVVGLANGECAEYLVQGHGLDLAESLVAALVAHGFGVREIRPERADLETLFLQLTRTEGPPCASS